MWMCGFHIKHNTENKKYISMWFIALAFKKMFYACNHI